MLLAAAAHGLSPAGEGVQEPIVLPDDGGAAFAEEYVYTEAGKRYPTGSHYCNNRGCIDMYSGYVEFIDDPGGPYLNFANQRATSIGHSPPALDFAGRGNWRDLAMEFRVLEAGANNASRGGPHVYVQFKDGARMYITHLSKINRALKAAVGQNIWFKPDTYIGSNDRLLGRIAHRFFHVHIQGRLPSGRDMTEQQIWRYLRRP